ncbi:MAG: hypothetical protein HYZ51_04630 [Candidatus Doudnabacteria bacterium]|nr:hypothetical protein [Candidatus Doudnabacteria bacterium]
MTLSIDTTEFGKVKFALENKSKTASQSFFARPQESGKILEYLDAFFQSNKISPPIPSRLRGGVGRGKSRTKGKGLTVGRITVYKGNGSFTGLRAAAAIAQALGLAWGTDVKVVLKS